MKTPIRNLVPFALLLALVMSAMPAAAQDVGAVALQASGRFARGGEFEGTITINKFQLDEDGKAIEAVGLVQGILRRGNRTIGTVLGGQVTLPVVLKAGNPTVAMGGASASSRPLRVGWTLVQDADVCDVVQVGLGPIDVNLLGIDVALSPVAFDLNGVVGTALGDLVCELSGLLGNVAGLVGLLNDILGLLTGLLGGLLPGLGGVIPTVQ